LDELIEQVVGGELEPYPASIAGQLIKVKIGLMEMERKLKETEDLEARVGELTQVIEELEREQRYGA